MTVIGSVEKGQRMNQTGERQHMQAAISHSLFVDPG